jgi:amidase
VLQSAFTDADGHPDVYENLALSGEPLVSELEPQFGNGPLPAVALSEFYKSTIDLRKWRTKYNDYWTSTSNLTSTGRAIDAILLPVAPHAAVMPGKSYHYGKSTASVDCLCSQTMLAYTTFVNLLDYVSVVVPVTFADSRMDVFNQTYEPKSELDRKNWEACR